MEREKTQKATEREREKEKDKYVELHIHIYTHTHLYLRIYIYIYPSKQAHKIITEIYIATISMYSMYRLSISF